MIPKPTNSSYPVIASSLVSWNIASIVSRSSRSYEESLQKKPKMDERFKEIQQLQKHYISLLRKLCQKLYDPRIKAIGQSDKALNKSILCMKQLAQYVPVLM